MKLGEIWGDFCFWRKRTKPILQLLIWVVGFMFIGFMVIKEFCEKRIKK